ncbi:hypothetical protein QKU48_gp0732 [Fadolivirus algeromassiliense]|jgi:hypothetical protein|uniref:Uncharacterized protein n=1 Tax=Fadolivirus FV1/VV64 TaxID=3070911 RepID=A0A7D3UTC6_9VIRU|nr:hypothetical protein QKU48_gp0732 [Fadolivirus algeromassiliense]QKF94190.1 hypothetical protein Fadolivirus_1_732 [Fadolivirus FV1/VV64]
MDISKIINKCHYCDDNMIIPNKYIGKYITKHIYNINKIEEMCRISDIACSYILDHYPDIIERLNINIKPDNRINMENGRYFRVRLFLHHNEMTKIPSLFTCNICNKDACMFHYTTSCFIFHKCNDCNKTTIICGWCQQETTEKYYCFYCDHFEELISDTI